jgi:hypothetical protein
VLQASGHRTSVTMVMEPPTAGTADADLCSRIRELQETLSAGTIALEISSRNARVAALQKRWDRLRVGLELILDQRGADMARSAYGASGLLVRTPRTRKRTSSRVANSRKHFRPPPSRSKSAAATAASRRCKTAGIACVAGLELILDQPGADMADLAAAPAGCWCRDYKGKRADRLVNALKETQRETPQTALSGIRNQ